MNINEINYIYVLILYITVLIGLFHYSIIDNTTKIIFWLLVWTCISETFTITITVGNKSFSIISKYKFPFYHFYAIILIIFMSLYFLRVLKVAHYMKLAFIIAVIWVIIGILNCIFFQPLNTLNLNTIL